MQRASLARAVWRKSSYSGGNGQCVEVAFAGEAVGVRDSKDRSGPVLVFEARDWAAFVAGVVGGDFGGR
ncbi:DUF397 domain-containing protein [Pseudonocardia sp. CNS-139]|nr:DUF397 domain-containing protein [Pseudonocardia sp. CNS-139]